MNVETGVSKLRRLQLRLRSKDSGSATVKKRCSNLSRWTSTHIDSLGGEELENGRKMCWNEEEGRVG